MTVETNFHLWLLIENRNCTFIILKAVRGLTISDSATTMLVWLIK